MQQVGKLSDIQGSCPETVVGVYLDRTVNMLIALLGIHKAGGAYLPMDPIFPKDRLMYMQEDAKVEIILSESALEGTLPQGFSGNLPRQRREDNFSIQ